MYLSARKHISKVDYNKLGENGDYLNAISSDYQDIVDIAGLTEVEKKKDVYGADVSVNCAYWRKANQIHDWFVNNIQNGEDECKEHSVSKENLEDLVSLCKVALDTKDSSLLPPSSGFFFGGTEIDKWYWAGLEDTIEQLDRVLKSPLVDKLSFYYQSSW